MRVAMERFSLFSDLPPEAHQALRAVAQERMFTKSEHLFHRGEPVGHVFLIVSGAVRTYRETPEGKVAGLHMAMSGQMLADAEFLNSLEHYTASGQAMEPAHVLVFPRRDLRVVMAAHPVIMLSLLRLVTCQMQQMRRDKEQLLTLKAYQRLGCFLMHVCDAHEAEVGAFPLIYTKSTLASGLGMEPETFSRALGQLKGLGVSLRGREAGFADMTAMDAHICQACSLSDGCEVRQRLQAQEALGAAAPLDFVRRTG